MRAWMIHTAFAGLLLGSFVANGRTTDVLMEADDIEAAVIRVARSHGLTLREDISIAAQPARTLAFDDPSCTQPISVALLWVTFEQEPLVRTVRRQRDVVRYVYLDRKWSTPDRLAVFLEWKKHRVLAMLGLTPYEPSRYMLIIGAPPDCQAADTIDWEIVWDRQYLTAVQADKNG